VDEKQKYFPLLLPRNLREDAPKKNGRADE